MHSEHIIPLTSGGKTESDNLALSCGRCNLIKGPRTHYPDPESGDTVRLFNPRQDSWHDHFAWDDEYIHIIGNTPVGRATIAALNMNHPAALIARRRLVQYGLHPPND